MAEAILSGVAFGILGRLRSYALQEIVLVWGVHDELQKLIDTLSTINAVLLDAEEQQEKNNQVKDWLKKLKDAVYDADDILDDFELDALQHTESVRNQVDNFFTSSNLLVFPFKMGHRIKELRLRLDAIAEDRKKFHFIERVVNNNRIGNNRETHSCIPNTGVIGRDEEKKYIVQLLLGENENGENLSIISIVGIGGLGKTTLAQLVYNDEKVVSHFQPRMWVCVSENFVVKDLIKQIIESATPAKCHDSSIDQLQKSLKKELDGKTFLLVLDDVWNENPKEWIDLKNLVVGSGGGRGSKIIVTTRSNRVASIMGGTVSSFDLSVLRDDDCWSLFKQMAFEQGQEQKHPNLVAIGKEIIQKCGGVPLVAMTLGGLLRFNTEENEWLSVKDNEIWELDQYYNNNILAALRLSYNHLPSYLKHCFAYCSLFPKDYEIDRAKLIQLWIAQGFIQSSSQGSHLQLEDIGNHYFKDLLSRSFFQDVCEDDYGNIKTCKMHDLIHDLATSVAGKECMIAQGNVENNFSEEVRHLSLLDVEFNSWKPLYKAKKLRTLLLACEIRVNVSGSTLDSLCSSLRLLRVLDLSHLDIQNLPSSVGKLKHLRFLNLSYNYFRTLPNSITKLKKLQVLNLDHCRELKELPKDIGKIISLRHLELDEHLYLSHMPSGLGQLSSLQTLSLFIVGKKGKKGCTLRELHGLNQLRGKLRICIYNNNLGNLRSSIDEAKEAKLKEKHNLGALTLEWDEEFAEGDDIMYREVVVEVLEVLQPHSNLKKLCIDGYKGMKFPRWMMDSLSLSLFQNLVSIEMGFCERVEHLPPFGQLPFLESLKLVAMDALKYIRGGDVFYGGGELDVVRGGGGGFPSLKMLSLDGMPNLEEWSREVSVAGDEEEGTSIATTTTQAQKLLSFPSLSELYISNLPMLMSIPLHPSLEKLTLLECSEKLVMKINPLGLMSLQYLEIESCDSLTCLSQGRGMMMNQFTSLKSLTISDGPKFEKWSTTEEETSSLSFPCLAKLNIKSCPMLTSMPLLLPSLENLSLEGCCQKLIQSVLTSSSSFASLKSFDIIFCEDLVAFPKEGLQNLISLERLVISNCPRLVCLAEEEEDGMKAWTPFLRELTINQCGALPCLPRGMHYLTSLQHLKINGCSNLDLAGETTQGPTNLRKLEFNSLWSLTILPKYWLGNLKLLQHLVITNCPNLPSFPDEMKCLTALQSLDIRGCPELSKRCKKRIGEDWSKIAHVPSILIDWKWMQDE